jgi:hypothetical protein
MFASISIPLKLKGRHSVADVQSQTVQVLAGHTNYVTSLILRGEMLISGSYDETYALPILRITPAAPFPLAGETRMEAGADS